MDNNQDILHPSGYNEESVNTNSEIFADKKPIKTTGTTCDAFSARYESRHVFVKRLKPEHSSNPVYRSAFQKEYEIGVSLYHNSVPLYIKCTGDTLILAFIDGKTLHQMVQENDPRLHNDRNIEKWVSQLLDVMDYLHRKNVIHCDIKTDNIMITNDTHNLVLIDFDKAFTASQDLTPGTPLNYAAKDESITKRQMDIRGVSNIIDRLSRYVKSENLKYRLSRLIAATKLPETTLPDLIDVWKSSSVIIVNPTKDSRKKFYTLASLGLLILIGILVVVWSKFNFEDSDFHEEVAQEEMEEPIAEILPIPALSPIPEISKVPEKEESSPRNSSETNQPSDDKEQIKIEKDIDANPEIIQETLKPISPDDAKWEAIVKEEAAPLETLLNQIEADMITKKIKNPLKIGELMIQINNEIYEFNRRVMKKYTPFHKLYNGGRDETLLKANKTRYMTALNARMNKLGQRMLDYQASLDYHPVSSVDELNDSLRIVFEKQVEKDLAKDMDYLKKIDESIKTTGRPINGRSYALTELYQQKMYGYGIFYIEYFKKFPEIYDANFEKLVSTTKPYKELASLRDSLINVIENK